MIDKIIVKDFRCFSKCHEIELRPLTFLVGENSTGKTSLMSAVRLATNLLTIPQDLDFNKEPFILGAYEQIAFYAGGRTGRAKYFQLGFEKNYGKGTQKWTLRLIATFIPKHGQPIISELLLTDKLYNIETKAEIDTENGKTRITALVNGVIKVQEESGPDGILWPAPVLRYFAKYFSEERKAKEHDEGRHLDFYEQFYFPGETSYAFAPVRTRPERTYDPKSDIPRPEGNHVPVVLRQIKYQAERQQPFSSEVENFGRESGLYKRIIVRPLGREADPFQILVKIAGPGKNLIDVGYGISQVLPILVDTLVRRERIFLMQQPEIHLHPRAQAALGTYFGHFVKTFNKQLLVETHSDYIIDRVCLDIRDKTTGIDPNDVIILFFQRKLNKPWVKVHKITIDEKGNIQGAPRDYRDFFLKEQVRLFRI